MSKRDTLIAVCVAGSAVAILAQPILRSQWERETHRSEVRGLYESLRTGMLRHEVEQRMQGDLYPHLQFSRGSGRVWYAESPLEFGAKNWVLLVECEEDRVLAVRVRTADSVQEHPKDAPPDK
jgi:hypothetical protein